MKYVLVILSKSTWLFSNSTIRYNFKKYVYTWNAKYYYLFIQKHL